MVVFCTLFDTWASTSRVRSGNADEVQWGSLREAGLLSCVGICYGKKNCDEMGELLFYCLLQAVSVRVGHSLALSLRVLKYP